jgi:hypothetical protein
MDWNDLSPYFLPLLVAAFLLRRAMREQKPKRVRFTRLWLFPALLLLVTVPSLLRSSAPGILWWIVYILSLGLGCAIGWYRVHTLEFSVDSESGKVSARATQFGAVLIVALIGLRYGADYVFKTMGLKDGGDLVYATNGMMILSTSMYVARSIHTWIRARALVIAHRSANSLADKSSAGPI